MVYHNNTISIFKSFSCTQCGMKFSRENHLNRQKSEVHRLISNINLDFASAKFEEFRRFKCDECGKAFTREETKTRHKSIVHATMNPAVMFKCKYCDKRFGRIDSMKRHQAIAKVALY